MNKVLFSILLLLINFSSVGQERLPFMMYFGSTREETKSKLQEYLYFYRYNGVITDSDSTVDIWVNQKGQEWTIFTSFHFDQKGLCDYHITTRCDKFKELALQNSLSNKLYQWVRVEKNKYLSNKNYREMLEIFRTDSCVLTKISPIKLTRKELRIQRQKIYRNGN